MSTDRPRPACRLTTLTLGLLTAWLLPSGAEACHETTVCFAWGAGFTDNDFGEDYALEDEVPARGARVVIIRPAPEPPLSTWLDGAGCTTFDTQYAYGHKAIIHADAIVGSVRIRPFANEEDEQDDITYHWEVDLQGLAEFGNAPVVVTNSDVDGDPETLVPLVPMMASATAVIGRFDDLGMIPAPANLALRFTPSTANARCFCDGVGLDVVEIGPESFQEKFVMAHELGHWLQAQWSGAGVGATGDYQYFVQNPACEFVMTTPHDLDMQELDPADGNWHGIRSAEESGGALVEGYAHFLAAVAYNDLGSEDGVFRYYKEIDLVLAPLYADFVAAESRVSLLGGTDPETLGGASRWVAENCPDDWSSGTPADEVTSEIDWLRFWWRFATEQSGSQPTIVQVLEFMSYVQTNYAWSAGQVHPHLRNAMDDAAWSAYLSRFDDITEEQGTFNDES